MKRIAFLIIMCVALVAGTADAKHYFKPYGSVSLFYSSLTPYGEWIELNAGYAWRPYNISHGWRPYLYGQWVWTDYGWYWVSSEPFGWAAYHYGRWEYDDYYGWIWVPDDVWGPAWVEWRYNDDYIGWAPLPPQATFSVDFGISYTTQWVAPMHYWNFVPCRYFTTTRVVDYIQPVERTRRFFGSTRGTVNIQANGDRVINRGVDVNFVERRGNTRVNRVDVVQREQGNGERFVRDADQSRIETYRPRLQGRMRQELAPPPRHDEQPASSDVKTGRDQRVLQRNNRGYVGEENNTYSPPARDTRVQERNAQEQVEQKRAPGYQRDTEKRAQVREQQRQPERQFQQQRVPRKNERGQQPGWKGQKEEHSRERRPRP